MEIFQILLKIRADQRKNTFYVQVKRMQKRTLLILSNSSNSASGNLNVNPLKKL